MLYLTRLGRMLLGKALGLGYTNSASWMGNLHGSTTGRLVHQPFDSYNLACMAWTLLKDPALCLWQNDPFALFYCLLTGDMV